MGWRDVYTRVNWTLQQDGTTSHAGVKINKEVNINIIIEGILLVWVGGMHIHE